MKGSRCLAVMYHYVRASPRADEPAVRGLTPEAFTRQLDLLCSHLEPINWSAFQDWKSGRTALPRRGFLLTFDDALVDHATVAAPILEVRGLRGMFFVPTGPLVTGRLSSTHQTHLLLDRLGAGGLRRACQGWLDRHGFPAHLDDVQHSICARRMYHYEEPDLAELKYLLVRVLPIDARRRLIDDLFHEHVGSSREYARRWYLNLAQMIELQEAGHTIGGHSHYHEMYTRLTPAQLQRDLQRTAAILRSGLGDRPRPFSYPFGDHDCLVADACRRTGFAAAFTTEPTWITRNDDDFDLGRCDTIAVESFLEMRPAWTP